MEKLFNYRLISLIVREVMPLKVLFPIFSHRNSRKYRINSPTIIHRDRFMTGLFTNIIATNYKFTAHIQQERWDLAQERNLIMVHTCN